MDASSRSVGGPHVHGRVWSSSPSVLVGRTTRFGAGRRIVVGNIPLIASTTPTRRTRPSRNTSCRPRCRKSRRTPFHVAATPPPSGRRNSDPPLLPPLLAVAAAAGHTRDNPYRTRGTRTLQPCRSCGPSVHQLLLSLYCAPL